jgi:hypothetical protein
MKGERIFLILLLVVPASTAGAFGMPEAAITRTFALKDIEASAVTVGVGIETELEEGPAYAGDSLFGYLGYAPWDCLEFGIGAHMIGLGIYPTLEAKIDVVEFFSKGSAVSCLVMGGVGGRPNDLWFYHAGLAVDVRIGRYLQLYLGAGSDSISSALSLQAGAYVVPLKWLGMSGNLKLVIGAKGFAPMLSFAPFVILRPADLGFRKGPWGGPSSSRTE